MFKDILKYSGLLIVLASVFGFGLQAVLAQWSEPGVTPPGGNVYVPINIGPFGQTKIGSLILNTGGAPYGLIVDSGLVGIGTREPGKALDVVGDVQARNGQLISTIGGNSVQGASGSAGGTQGTGNAPINVASSKLVVNLNSDLLDGYHASAFGDATLANQMLILSKLGLSNDTAGMDTTLFGGQQAIYNLLSSLNSLIGGGNDSSSMSTTIFAGQQAIYNLIEETCGDGEPSDGNSSVTYLGTTSTSYNGNLGGVIGANAKCVTAFPDNPGAHFCSGDEITRAGRSTSLSNGWARCGDVNYYAISTPNISFPMTYAGPMVNSGQLLMLTQAGQGWSPNNPGNTVTNYATCGDPLFVGSSVNSTSGIPATECSSWTSTSGNSWNSVACSGSRPIHCCQ